MSRGGLESLQLRIGVQGDYGEVTRRDQHHVLFESVLVIGNIELREVFRYRDPDTFNVADDALSSFFIHRLGFDGGAFSEVEFKPSWLIIHIHELDELLRKDYSRGEAS